ncbi:MAG: ester cyclase [Prosthecobacter sp.]|nr:ester cyclase [Prosthecobacter sp.]
MKLTSELMDQKIDEHFGYEARDDIAGVLATLAPDATHDVVGWPMGPSQGREAARGFYNALFADLAEGKVTPTRRLYGEDFLVDESFWEGSAPGRPFGLEGLGRPLSFRLLHVVEFTGEGQIQKEQVWVDLAAILQQLPQGAQS